VSFFDGDAAEAADSILAKVPEGYLACGSVALFSCLLRGINWHGRNDVECSDFARKLPGCRAHGMFCYGELGPQVFEGFVPPALPRQPCQQHAVTTVVAVHTVKEGSSQASQAEQRASQVLLPDEEPDSPTAERFGFRLGLESG